MSDLTTTIENAVANPSAVTVDGQSVTFRPLADLIAADKYLAGKDAAASGFKGLKRQRLRSGDAIGNNRADT